MSGQLDVWLWSNRDFPTEDDDYRILAGLLLCRFFLTNIAYKVPKAILPLMLSRVNRTMLSVF